MPVVAINPPNTLPVDRLMSREPAPAARQRGRVMLISYEAQQPAFAGLNPKFDGPDFLVSAQAYLAEADAASANDARAAARDLAFQAQTVVHAEAFRLIKPLYYAIGQAWANKAEVKAHLKAFGKAHYEDARDTTVPLLELLNLAIPAAQDPTTAAALAAKGWGAPQLATLDAARVALQKAHEDAGRQVGLSGEQAVAYYRAQNNFYWFMQQLNEAADVLYTDPADAPLEKQFRLGPAAPERFQFTLKPGQTKAVAHGPLSPDRVLRCTVKVAQPDAVQPTARLWLDFLPVEGAEVEQRVALLPTAPYQTQKVLVSALGDPGPLLAVQNLTAADAVVSITVGE